MPLIDQGHKRKKPDPETSPEYDQSPEARDIVSAGELTSEQIKNLSPDQRERFGVGTLTHSVLDNPHWYGPGAQELIKGKDGELIGPLNLDGDGNILGEDEEPVIIWWQVYPQKDFRNIIPGNETGQPNR